MAIVLKVKWVEKTDQPASYQRLRQIGGEARDIRWHHTQAEAIQFIEHNLFVYYVEKDARALELKVERAPDGSKYLKTTADDEQLQFLLNLPTRPGSVRISGSVAA
jgi:hypothetical protein